jgi:hypothetical protein
MHLTALVSYIGILLLCGCSTPPQHGSEKSRPDSQGLDMVLTDVEAGTAQAIRSHLTETQQLNDMLRTRNGTLFLDDVDPAVVNVIKRDMGHKLPTIETNRAFFHDFTDTRSGRWARIIGLRIMSQGPDSLVLEIRDGYGNLGGTVTIVELRKSNGKWVVVDRRVVGVS